MGDRQMISWGWPFLLARGRRTGHRVLLAPDFLVAEHDHGILEAVSGQGPDVTELTSFAGRRLTLRCSTHQVSARDVTTPERPRDEHGRPLRLIYGVVANGTDPVTADLQVALEAALDTYRRFLGGEDGFVVVQSPAFPLTVPASPARSSTVDSAGTGVRRGPRPRYVAVLSAAAVLVILLATVVAVLWGRSGDGPAPSPPPQCPTTSAAPSTTTTGPPTPTTTQCPTSAPVTKSPKRRPPGSR